MEFGSSSSVWFGKQNRLPVKMPKLAQKPESEEEEEAPAPKMQISHFLKRKEKPKQEEPEEPEQEEGPRTPRKGVMGKLKDYLGIV